MRLDNGSNVTSQRQSETRRKHALQIFRVALAASDPQEAVLRHLKFDGRTLLAGRKKYPVSKFDRIQVIGDDYLVTSAERVRAAALERSVNALLVKVNQAGTVTDAKAACDEARRLGWGTIVSARSGETEDVTIVHLAIGWGAGQLKVGSFARSERMAKWNEALRIEEALGSNVRFAGLDETPARRRDLGRKSASGGDPATLR